MLSDGAKLWATRLVALSVSISLGCSGGTRPFDGASANGDAGAGGAAVADAGLPSGASGSTSAGAPTHDGLGYAIVGRNVYPPLHHRVVALPCPELSNGSGCTTDAECGTGMACVCADPWPSCVPAECLSDADCAEGLCLVSRGPNEGCCSSVATPGLYCERAESTCVDGGDCPGNGIACAYVADTDRFECQIISCNDCTTQE